MISPHAIVLSLLAVTFVIVGLGARLLSDARRQQRNRRWASGIVDAAPGREEMPSPAPAQSTARPGRAPVLEMPSLPGTQSAEPDTLARTTEALEEQAFEAARQSLEHIVGQTEELLGMQEVRRNERIDVAVRGVAAQSGWLLRALDSLTRVREDRPPDTELCSISGLLQAIDEQTRPLAAERRNTCTFENEAGELWLLADATLVQDSVTHFISALCLAVKDVHISVRVTRWAGAAGAELRWTITDDASPKNGRAGVGAPFWLRPGHPASVVSLALAEEIGVRLGGTLEVTGVPGQGGTLGLKHPVIVAGDAAPAMQASEPGESMRVLAVGGDGDTNELLQRCFSYHGHHVSFAANIIEAARAAEPECPDVIVCDLDSPECGNGLLALTLAVGTATPVPILGLRQTVGLDEEAAPTGCSFVIAKSEADEKLVARVRDSLRRSGGRFSDRKPAATSLSYLLLVDPDTESTDQLVARLEAASFSVRRADSASSAMMALEAREYDAVVIAESLSDMSGLELLRILRSRYTASQLPVLLSGAPVPETVVQSIAFGANDFLAKPLELAVTIARISTQLARKRAEQALRESEERYMLTARGANDGLWDWDCRSGRVHYSPRWKEMVGLHADTPCSSVIDWLSRVHPEDRSELERRLEHALKDASEAELVSEHRMLHLDGLHRWVLCRAVVLHDDTGQPVRIAGSHTDITRTKTSDPLTGLANRVMFNDRIGTFMDRYQGDPGRPFSVLFLDLDRFKQINDSLGHAAGDQLLVEVGRRLNHVVTQQFPEARHIVARLGGDEFGVILMPAGEAVARGAAEAMLAEFERPFRIEGREIVTAASIGVACVHGGYTSVMDLVRDADTAMYRAKANGKARYEVFDATMRAAAVARAQLTQELSQAVKAREFELFYQPKIDLNSGRLAGFEALVRWRHPARGLLSPMEFIPVAEETGLILPLGAWVLQEACRQLKEWSAVAPGCRVSVNVSARQFQDPKLAQEVREMISAAGLNPSSLQLEITESVVAEDIEEAARILDELKQTGVELELDDFGTGYSSLSRLAKLPLDTVKIDRSFISQLQRGGSGMELVRAILSLASSLRLSVVAEGVETEEQLGRLVDLGCPVAQGFLFGVPVRAEEAAARLGKTSAVAIPQRRSRRERRRLG
jgi:diguanylate cyclase (GGDEF)-like protein/PAS domain S-box-containing protein